MKKPYWICCPRCGEKTKVRAFEDTVMLNFPLMCPKCKKETVINVVKLKVVISEEPDE